jgi:hypothetical protein
MKKWVLYALCAVILIQLFVPAYMIYNKYDILRTGEEFMFRVNPIDPYDAFRGRYVALNARQSIRGNGRYGRITVGDDGFAYIDWITENRPASGAFVKSSSRDRFTLPIESIIWKTSLRRGRKSGRGGKGRRMKMFMLRCG